MDTFQNPKVVGAFLIGFAIVAGAYVISNFGQPRQVVVNNAIAADEAPPRVYIPVEDKNQDGLEDWRDQFVTGPAIVVPPEELVAYTAPTTLTERLGVNLVEGMVKSTIAGPLAAPKEKVLNDALLELRKTATSDKIYGIEDVIVASDESDATIRAYGNRLATVLLENKVGDFEHEFKILENYVNTGSQESLSQLKQLLSVYKSYRDTTLATPVPPRFAKQHLDLINVYHALYSSLEAMTKAAEDPVLPFLRLQRHSDDMKGLAYALYNMYQSFLPYANIFELTDPAVLLVNYSNNQTGVN